MDCSNIPYLLVKAVHETNNELISHMIDKKTNPQDVCIKTDVTHDYYYTTIMRIM